MLAKYWIPASAGMTKCEFLEVPLSWWVIISSLAPYHHASNALALAGNLPRDKDKLLLQLREAIAGHRPLRPHFLRGL